MRTRALHRQQRDLVGVYRRDDVAMENRMMWTEVARRKDDKASGYVGNAEDRVCFPFFCDGYLARLETSKMINIYEQAG